MPLRILAGAAGTGKTKYCMEEILRAQASHKGRQLYIVPEQFTSQAERDLTAMTERKGILTAEVLSFGRLAYQILSKSGGSSRVLLGETGKQMVLVKTLLSLREEMNYFRHMTDKQGFAKQLGLTVTEFFRYDVTPETLEEMAAQEDLSPAAQAKLRDLALIFRSYQDFLRQDYLSGDETLTLLSQALENTSAWEDTEVWLDGFYGFTPQEYGVLAHLLRLAKRVTVTLPMTEGAYYTAYLPPYAAFYEPKLTKERLLALAEETHTPVERPLFLRKNLRGKQESLRFLEENYFGCYRKSPDHTGIHICACPTKQEEIQYAAAQIRRLVREEGLRYRDIAIVTNAMELYETSLRGILAEYDIPCFIDARRDISAHPLLALLRGTLDILVYDFRYEGVFSYLKSGLTGISQEETDILENYVLAYGIKGYKWRKSRWEWGFGPGEENACGLMNALKEKVLSPFACFQDIQRGKAYPLSQMAQCLRRFLEELPLREQLSLWMEQEQAKGNSQRVEEHRQILQIFLQVLEKAVEILGKETMTIDAFSQILLAGLEESTLGMIPPSVDALVAGDLERSRLPEIRVLFVLGANEGILPSPAAPQGIFTEAERAVLTEKGMELAPDGKRRLYEEQFLIYRGLTKPSESLYLTYACGDTEGNSLFPSSLIDRIRRMYPALTIEQPALFSEELLAPAACFHGLGEQLAAPEGMSAQWQDIYSYFFQSPVWREKTALLLEGLTADIRQEKLSPKVTKALFGKNILSSVSRLERFAACPFSYFAEYGLKAEERKLYQLRTPDLGILFHGVLEAFSAALEAEGRSWQALTQEETKERISAAVEAAAPLLGSDILLDSAANRYLIRRLKRISFRAAWTLAQHIQSGQFVPSAFELGFGPKEALPPIVIAMADGSRLILRGKMDRVDLLDADGTRYVKIIDYKSGSKSFHFQDIYYGLQLQLLIYLDTYLKTQGGNGFAHRPGGVFYFQVTDPTLAVTRDMTAQQIQQELYDKMRMSGLVLNQEEVIRAMDLSLFDEKTGHPSAGESSIIPLKYNKNGTPSAASYVAGEEDYYLLMDFVVQQAAKIGQQMKAGVITPSPYRKKDQTPCAYCKYGALCRYDYKDRPHYRDLKKMDAAAFWEELHKIQEEKEQET